MAKVKLTANDQAVWIFLEAYIKAHNYPPTHREIQDAVGLASSSSTLFILRKLEAAGVVKTSPNIARGTILLRHPPRRWRSLAAGWPGYFVCETVDGRTRQLNEKPISDVSARGLFNDRIQHYGRDCILHMRQGDFNHVEARREADGALIAELAIVESRQVVQE